MTSDNSRPATTGHLAGPRTEGVAGYERVFDWAGQVARWDDEAVMPWSLALELSRADPQDRAELADLHEAVREDLYAALEAKEMHRLRGHFLGQAAEAEGAVIDLAQRLCARGSGRNRMTFGGALKAIHARLEATHGVQDTSKPWLWYRHLKWLSARRNQLTHAHLRVGMARQHPSADLEPIISLIFEIQAGTPVDWASAPTMDGRAPRGADEYEVDESVLQEDLWRAWVATCSAAALHSHLLPEDRSGSDLEMPAEQPESN